MAARHNSTALPLIISQTSSQQIIVPSSDLAIHPRRVLIRRPTQPINKISTVSGHHPISLLASKIPTSTPRSIVPQEDCKVYPRRKLNRKPTQLTTKITVAAHNTPINPTASAVLKPIQPAKHISLAKRISPETTSGLELATVDPEADVTNFSGDEPISLITANNPRTDVAFKARSLHRFPNYGHATALTLAKSTSRPLRFVPSEGKISTAPLVKVPWYNQLNAKQRRQANVDIRLHLESLTQSDRATFLSGRRLSDQQRKSLLHNMSEDSKHDSGLRFSSEPSPFFDTEAHAAVRDAPSIHSGRQTPPDVLVILADLWNFADPLLLDLACDAWSNGVNVGYNGKYTSSSAKNMSRSKEEIKTLRDTLQDDISQGFARGFFASQPFPECKIIPAGLVLKKDGTQRPVENYSKFKSQSVNALSDNLNGKIPHTKLDESVETFHKAGKDAVAVKWDIEKAYQFHSVRHVDHWLMVLFVPGEGYVYRTHCPFGLAASGYRWEILGGRLAHTHYKVMQSRMTVNVHTHEVTLAPAATFPREEGAPDPLLEPPSATLTACTRDTILHPVGQARLEKLIQNLPAPPKHHAIPNLSGITRNVDDFITHLANVMQAIAVAVAIVYIHARMGMRLKLKKFSHVVRSTDFKGYDFLSPYTISYPPDKQNRLRTTMQELMAFEHTSWDEVQTAIGSCLFLVGMFPQLRGMMSPLYDLLYKQRPETRQISENSKSRRVLGMTKEAINVCNFFIEIIDNGPKSASSFLRPQNVLPSQSHAFFHTDWGFLDKKSDLWTAGAQGWGVAALSENKYTFSVVPPEFIRWCIGINGCPSSPSLEAFGVVLCLLTFGASLAHSIITIFTDNMPFLQAYHKCYNAPDSSSPHLASAIREITRLLIKHSIYLCLEFVPTKHNMADPISRHIFQDFMDRLGSLGYSRSPCAVVPCLPTIPLW
jgi:hypothetical protein